MEKTFTLHQLTPPSDMSQEKLPKTGKVKKGTMTTALVNPRMEKLLVTLQPRCGKMLLLSVLGCVPLLKVTTLAQGE
jgi:hypothetical protein